MKARWLIISLGLCLALGTSLTAFAGPLPGGADNDLDGVEDAFDNCLNASNADQADADHDGCGDVCSLSCDANKDGITNITDFLALQACFNQPASCNPNADCNNPNDGIINISDFLAMQAEFNTSSGPSGLLAQFKKAGCN